jgi:hypothetical protein
MKNLMLFVLMACFSVSGFSYEKRDLLQKEAGEINLAGSCVKDFSALVFPDTPIAISGKSLPDNLRQQYIQEAESYLGLQLAGGKGYRLPGNHSLRRS